ncbi:helix-turn-helix transcriptional regulator [Pandoraea pnomenusa]|uniref:helix-turn-helix domain-containing protein n=1 Tax=Pandoraea pnomenusa TaxID=93220 RepID=UPI0011989C7B|nr:helix-turn-helix transcriptional regulator [Pandoraea pnomenusa]QDX23296.1 helix-turn-helix transcriptional regulator [Pandoraea pnomenusa]
MPNPIHDPKYQVFRQMLLDARKEKGLQQVEVAERLGKTQSFVSKYERGERRLDFCEFIEVAAALEIDVAEFIERYLSSVVVAQPHHNR